jgi:hypothetical protein
MKLTTKFATNCKNHSNINKSVHDNKFNQILYLHKTNIKKVNPSCINNSRKLTNFTNPIVFSNKNYFALKCALVIFISCVFVVIFNKIYYLIYNHWIRKKYSKISNKDFEKVILINENNYQNQTKYKSFESV